MNITRILPVIFIALILSGCVENGDSTGAGLRSVAVEPGLSKTVEKTITPKTNELALEQVQEIYSSLLSPEESQSIFDTIEKRKETMTIGAPPL